MSLKYKLAQFEGPLDLLVQLIESADLDITEVALAEVTDQFMEHLSQVEETNPEELADFLVVASRLLLIKSKILLPNLHLEKESEALTLETQLKIYKEYYEASKKIEAILAEKNILFSRNKIPLDLEVIFNPPQKLDRGDLKKIFLQIIQEIEPVIQAPKKSILRAISIREKIKSILAQIQQHKFLKFDDLIANSQSRTEVVVSFLGILELIKQRNIVVKQDQMFSEITIEPVTTE